MEAVVAGPHLKRDEEYADSDDSETGPFVMLRRHSKCRSEVEPLLASTTSSPICGGFLAVLGLYVDRVGLVLEYTAEACVIADVEAYFTSKFQAAFQSQKYESFMDFAAIFHTAILDNYTSAFQTGCSPSCPSELPGRHWTNSGSRCLCRWRLPAHVPDGGGRCGVHHSLRFFVLLKWLVENCLNTGVRARSTHCRCNST